MRSKGFLRQARLRAWVCITAALAFSHSLNAAQSGPIALSSDDHTLLNVNPDANTLTVFDVSTDAPSTLAEIPVGADPESVAIHPGGRTAFVANSLDGTVSIVDLTTLRTTGTLTAGSEPMALTLSPNGTRLYVANSASDNLMVFDTTAEPLPKLIATIGLSPYGSAPRAIAVTSGTSDAAQTIFVAMFFSQVRAKKGAAQEGQDDQREGHVIAISAKTNKPAGSTIRLGPLANTRFNSNGKLVPGVSGTVAAIRSTNPQFFTVPTGAFPNQLASIAIQPGHPFAYVVSTGASPNGPFRFDSNAQGLVSVFNTVKRAEITGTASAAMVIQTAPLNLDNGVDLATSLSPTLFHTNPVAIAWRPDGTDAWIAIQHNDLVVRMTSGATGLPTIGAPFVTGTGAIVRADLEASGTNQIPGKAPRGIVINSTGTRAYVSNYISRSVTVLDISKPTTPSIAGTAQSTAPPAPGSADETAQKGAELFYTGRGPEGRMSNMGWGACIVCHPGGRSDNVTWMLADGPAQTIPLDGTLLLSGSAATQRILEWSATRDEVQDSELTIRNVSGGRGLIDDDRLYFAIGGATGSAPDDSAAFEEFNQATGNTGTNNDLENGASLPAGISARRDFAVATLADDRVFIIGGRAGPGEGTLITADPVLEFNPRTNTITTRSSTGFTPRYALGAAAVITSQGPRIYAIGGYAAATGTDSPVPVVEEYNPAADSWRAVASLPSAVAQFGVAVSGGINTAEPLQLIHVVLGNSGSELSPSLSYGSPLSTPVQRFQADPSGPGTWSGFDPGLTPRYNLGAACVQRGVQSRIFVVGGQDAGGNVLNKVEEYLAQAVVRASPPPAQLPSGRAQFGIAGSLSTNQVYVAGGIDTTGSDQAAILELSIDTPGGAWNARGALSAPRHSLQLSTPPGMTALLPFANSGRSAAQDAIAAFLLNRVRACRAPVSAAESSANRGRALFARTGLVTPGLSCASCHGGPKWTRSTVDYAPPPSPELGLGLGSERVIGAELRQTATQGPNAGQQPGVLVNVGTFNPKAINEIRASSTDISQAIAPLGPNGYNIPSLLSVSETAPYFHNGSATTLAHVLDGSVDGNRAASALRVHFVRNGGQRSDLIRFLESIDDTTATFP